MTRISDHLKMENELSLLMNVQKLESGVYFLSTGLEQTSSLIIPNNPIAFLPFCIRNPKCVFRREYSCDFSLNECVLDQTKLICDILDEYNIPYCFNNFFNDVDENIKKIGPLDLFIILICPKELIEIKRECYRLLVENRAPALVFLLSDYESCFIQEQSRMFDGQAKLDINQFKSVLDSFFVDSKQEEKQLIDSFFINRKPDFQ